eukprot:GSChrysophyteH1.ASY1.ANO1.2004.1 assembled CDS
MSTIADQTSVFRVSEWQDIDPVAQDDGPEPVAAIKYSDDFRTLMDYFRAVLRKEEYSTRSLMLTQAILDHNAANYTLWHHRRCIVESLRDPSKELAFTEIVFKVDAKNYHAWAHRQWTLKTYNLDWDKELAYTEALIESDIRNNSAWNQRWFVIHNRPNSAGTGANTSIPVPVPLEVYQSEIQWTWGRIILVQKNESAWNYFRGLSNICPSVTADVLSKCEHILKEAALKAVEPKEDTDSPRTNNFAMALAADIYEEIGTIDAREKAASYLTALMDSDKIRIKAYQHRLEVLSAKSRRAT